MISEVNPPPHRPVPPRWRTFVATVAPFAATAAVAGLIGGFVTHRAEAPQPVPTLLLQADGELRTATVTYADGSRGEAYPALAGPWRPDRPVRMVVVASTEACSITVDERLAVTEAAATNRLAVCVWTAP